MAPVSGEHSYRVHEVWSWNLEAEFNELATIVAAEAHAILAFDTEFPGFLRQEHRSAAPAARYEALRENVDVLRPIQLGVSVASADGEIRGTWSFNLAFDLSVDLHSACSVELLRGAGVDFARHATEGIDIAKFSQLLKDSPLFAQQYGGMPLWVTFSGVYDFGFLLKTLTGGRALPLEESAFEELVSAICPWRIDLQDYMTRGSLNSLARRCGIERHGVGHTAGSDALLTLELYLHWRSCGFYCEPVACSDWLLRPDAVPFVPAQASTPSTPSTFSPSPSLPSPAASTVAPAESDSSTEAEAEDCGSEHLGGEKSTALKRLRRKDRHWFGDPPVATAPESTAPDKLACTAPSGTVCCTAATKQGSPSSALRRWADRWWPRSFCFTWYVHSMLLCMVFPPSIDTLIWLPTQVLVLLLLVHSKLMPRPPHQFVSAYLAGCCCRLVAVVIRLSMAHLGAGA
mmetsp:Transcript_62508/g.161010  ORF Transcript_62508/g.161010 Transcript_62508/m.161010 type:complete len:459 (+) Transcript_62508:95-1471(+)